MRGWASTLLVLAWSFPALAQGDPRLPHVDLFPPLTGTPTVAPARPPPPPTVIARPPPPPPAYYGYQTIVVRAVGAAVFAVGAVVGDDAEGAGAGLAVAGVTIFVIGPVVVHGIHGQPRNAVLSFGLNLLLTGAGLGAGIGVGAGSNDDLGAVFGGMVGVGLAQVTMLILDATWLGFEDEPRGPDVAWSPTLLRDPEGAPLPGLVVAF